MKTLSTVFLLTLCAAFVLAQPLPDPFTVLEVDSGSQFVDARVTMRDSVTADIFYLQERGIGNSRLLHAVVSLAAEQIVAGPEELPCIHDWTSTISDVASRGADGWVAITYGESPNNLGTLSFNRTLLMWGNDTLTESTLLDTGCIHGPMMFDSDHNNASLSLTLRQGGGWLASWVHQGSWDNGSWSEPSNKVRVVTFEENFTDIADQFFAERQVGLWGPDFARMVSWSTDSILALLQGYGGYYSSYLNWVPRYGDVPDAFPVNSQFLPLDFRRTHGGRLLTCADGSRIFELHPSGTCDSLGNTGLADDPASIAWHPDFGYALLENFPHVIMLARVDTSGHAVQPLGVFYDGGSDCCIAFSSAAIAPYGRIAVVWGEQPTSGSACTTLRMAWINWTTYLGTSDRNVILHPSSFILSCFPNPFNARMEIRFNLPEAGKVELSLFDILGRRVATLADQPFLTGEHSVSFDGSNLGSGIYFARLSASHHQTTLKIMLIR